MLFRQLDRSATTTRTLLAVSALILLAACDKGEPPALVLKGDSIHAVARQEFAGGVKSIECAFTVDATATGPKGSSVTIKKGLVVYRFSESGDTVMKRPIDAATAADFFDGKTTLESGTTLTTKRQAMSLSTLMQPIRGEVTFDYTAGKDTTLKTTAPYTFICR